MIIWEEFNFWFRILCIMLALNIVLYFIIQYLIKSNKIKPSKFTRLIYEDDERFIENWEKQREKSKFRYFIAVISKYYLIYTLVLLLLIGGNVGMLKERWPSFLGTLIGCTIGAPIGRAIREDKYIRLTENATINKDDINQE